MRLRRLNIALCQSQQHGMGADLVALRERADERLIQVVDGFFSEISGQHGCWHEKFTGNHAGLALAEIDFQRYLPRTWRKGKAAVDMDARMVTQFNMRQFMGDGKTLLEPVVQRVDTNHR